MLHSMILEGILLPMAEYVNRLGHQKYHEYRISRSGRGLREHISFYSERRDVPNCAQAHSQLTNVGNAAHSRIALWNLTP